MSALVATLHGCLTLCRQALTISELSTSVGQEASWAAILMSAKIVHSSEAQGPLPSALADSRTQFFVVVVL